MSIVISIVKLPDSAVNTKATHTFAHQGGTIGRSSDNEWVLEDEERFISSQHSKISFENGQYYITDLSTNGTFSNGSPEPIGKGNTVQLNDGDKFALGDYEFLASAWQPENDQAANLNQGPFASNIPDSAAKPAEPQIEQVVEQDYFSSANLNVDNFASPLSTHSSHSDALFNSSPIETDPLAALDNARKIPEAIQPENNYFSSASQSDQANPMQQAVSWPDSNIEAGAIPEDWESDLLASIPPEINTDKFASNEIPEANTFHEKPAIDKKSALEQANEKILAEIEILKKQAQKDALQRQIEKNTKVQQPSKSVENINRSSTSNEQSLIQALGLDANSLSDEKVIDINKIVGELVRETITGMMQVLSSRDAIENMFLKDGNAYKKPVEAIKEGFEGIAEHQIAILAGIRTAFKGVLNRFDPAVLEQRFEKFSKPGIIPGMSKAKNWDSYKHYYNELVDDMDNSFQHLFGYEFVQAYEEQLQKLSIARKTKN